MCEPMHSIVQLPPEDMGGPPTSPQSPISSVIHSAFDFCKKVGNWFHYSKLGSGHHESMRSRGLDRYVSDAILYEANWWERTVKLDCYGNPFIKLMIHDVLPGMSDYDLTKDQRRHVDETKRDSLESAKMYADSVSIGSLSSLRNFLKQSILKSDRPEYYLDRFRSMLTPAGSNKLTAKLVSINPDFSSPYNMRDTLAWHIGNAQQKDKMINSVIKAMLGMTRRRELLTPPWADDPKLWTGNELVNSN